MLLLKVFTSDGSHGQEADLPAGWAGGCVSSPRIWLSCKSGQGMLAAGR